MWTEITENNISEWFDDSTINSIKGSIKDAVLNIKKGMKKRDLKNSEGIDGNFCAVVSTVKGEQVNLLIDYTAEWITDGAILNYGLAVSDTVPDSFLDDYNDNEIKINL